MQVVPPSLASDVDLSTFHSQGFIDCVKRMSGREDQEREDEDAEAYGLVYDCPAFPGVYSYAAIVAGASLKAAEVLIDGSADVAVNWPGGWHHAKRDEASGFCYFNDLVVAILKLRNKYERVLYVDLDLHHGDGVEDAFCASPSVMTVSFHKHSPGFFPGSGSLTDIGVGKGRYYSVNVPLDDGITDSGFLKIFSSVMEKVREAYKPLAIVCQCGVDGLVGDPCASFNLTPASFSKAVTDLQSWNIPLLLTGGGGYNFVNAARSWTTITAAVTGHKIPSDIPEHKYFTKYGPDYDLSITAGNQRDKNTSVSLMETIDVIHANLGNVKCCVSQKD